MRLPALPLGTALVLVAFLVCFGGLTAYLISRGNVRLEAAVGLVLVGALGTVGSFMQGLRAPAPPVAAEPEATSKGSP